MKVEGISAIRDKNGSIVYNRNPRRQQDDKYIKSLETRVKRLEARIKRLEEKL